jgi:hypothetical protein
MPHDQTTRVHQFDPCAPLSDGISPDLLPGWIQDRLRNDAIARQMWDACHHYGQSYVDFLEGLLSVTLSQRDHLMRERVDAAFNAPPPLEVKRYNDPPGSLWHDAMNL